MDKGHVSFIIVLHRVFSLIKLLDAHFHLEDLNGNIDTGNYYY